jgi:hypothetical protein
MSLEQYKDASRKELWDILQIQMQVLQAEVAKIAELEKELTELKAYKAKLLAHVKYSSTQEEVEIIKLEQQAKGINDFKEWVLDTDENTSGLDVRDISLIEFYVEPLISQAKALKEQEK